MDCPGSFPREELDLGELCGELVERVFSRAEELHRRLLQRGVILVVVGDVFALSGFTVAVLRDDGRGSGETARFEMQFNSLATYLRNHGWGK